MRVSARRWRMIGGCHRHHCACAVCGQRNARARALARVTVSACEILRLSSKAVCAVPSCVRFYFNFFFVSRRQSALRLVSRLLSDSKLFRNFYFCILNLMNMIHPIVFPACAPRIHAPHPVQSLIQLHCAVCI